MTDFCRFIQAKHKSDIKKWWNRTATGYCISLLCLGLGFLYYNSALAEGLLAAGCAAGFLSFFPTLQWAALLEKRAEIDDEDYSRLRESAEKLAADGDLDMLNMLSSLLSARGAITRYEYSYLTRHHAEALVNVKKKKAKEAIIAACQQPANSQ